MKYFRDIDRSVLFKKYWFYNLENKEQSTAKILFQLYVRFTETCTQLE